MFPPKLYEAFDRDTAIAMFGVEEQARILCDGQWVIWPEAAVCLAEIGEAPKKSHFTSGGTNACRVVYVIDEVEPIRRFAFAYGTLPEHAESGEERFQVEWHGDDSVWYDIFAFSRPNQLFSRLAYPYVRYKQKQFAQDSMRAMKAAIS